MRTVRTIDGLRGLLAPARREGWKIGLVPTMGAFHDGHLSLMREARTACDVVVVSLFVNPKQFNEAGDLAGYPRDERRDADLAADASVDYLFAPPAAEVYPSGFSTTVRVSGVTEPLEGAHRGAAHFDGVATVVVKLLNIVCPDVAYFGQKDLQQTVVVRRLVADLNIPTAIEVCPTVREPDGLAMSSRNVRLSTEQRRQATALSRVLRAIRAQHAAGGVRSSARLLAEARRSLETADLEVEYLDIIDPATLAPVARLDYHPAVAVVAARLGTTRLIDNITIGGTATCDRP